MPKVFLSEDYLFRIISQALRALAAIAGLKVAKQYQEAEQLINDALEGLFGLRADLLKQLDDARLLEMLTVQDNLDLQRLALAADLFKEEGEILTAQGDQAGGARSTLRALNFYLESALDGPAQIEAELASKISALTTSLQSTALPQETLFNLFNFYEKIGQFRPAEMALAQLEASAPGNEDLAGEFYDFYQRLLEKPDAVLTAGGMDRAEIEAKLAEFEVEE